MKRYWSVDEKVLFHAMNVIDGNRCFVNCVLVLVVSEHNYDSVKV